MTEIEFAEFPCDGCRDQSLCKARKEDCPEYLNFVRSIIGMAIRDKTNLNECYFCGDRYVDKFIYDQGEVIPMCCNCHEAYEMGLAAGSKTQVVGIEEIENYIEVPAEYPDSPCDECPHQEPCGDPEIDPDGKLRCMEYIEWAASAMAYLNDKKEDEDD